MCLRLPEYRTHGFLGKLVLKAWILAALEVHVHVPKNMHLQYEHKLYSAEKNAF